MKWISIKKKKPKNGRILIWDGEQIDLIDLSHEFYKNPHIWEKNGILGRVTHWIDCPKQPKTLENIKTPFTEFIEIFLPLPKKYRTQGMKIPLFNRLQRLLSLFFFK